MMQSHRIVVLLLGFLVAQFVAAESKQELQYSYRDPYTEDTWTINDVAHVISDGHSKITMRWCPDHSKCAMAGLVQFGITTDWQRRSEWEIHDVIFKKIGPREVTLLGKKINAFLIRSTIQSVDFWYLMSPHEGLIGFGAKHPEGKYLQFWSETNCGFAASKRCSN